MRKAIILAIFAVFSTSSRPTNLGRLELKGDLKKLNESQRAGSFESLGATSSNLETQKLKNTISEKLSGSDLNKERCLPAYGKNKSNANSAHLSGSEKKKLGRWSSTTISAEGC